MFRDSRYAGSWTELTERLESEATVARWAATEPVLAGAESVADLLERWSDEATKYATLSALIRLAAAEGGRDDEALLFVLHLTSSLALMLAARFHDLGDRVLDAVVSALALTVRGYRLERWRAPVVDTLYWRTREAVVAEFRPKRRYTPEFVQIPTDDEGLGRVADAESYRRWTDSTVEFEDLAGWATGRGVEQAEIDLLVELEIERRQYRSSANERVAARCGVTERTLLRRRARVLAELRALAPAYLADVA